MPEPNAASEVIELSELRISNILSFEGRLVYVTSLSLDVDDENESQIGFCYVGESSNEKAGGIRSFGDKLKRVPISAELLGQDGFRYLVWENFLQFTHLVKHEIVVRILENEASIFTFNPCSPNNRNYITTIKYHHQLQNIFFTMLGEEMSSRSKEP